MESIWREDEKVLRFEINIKGNCSNKEKHGIYYKLEKPISIS